MAGRGELAGECLTGEPAVAVPGRLKLWGRLCGKVWVTGVCCGGPKGFEGPKELLPLGWGSGICMLLSGLGGGWGRLKGGGEEPRPFVDLNELSAGRDEDAGRWRIGEELASGARDGEPYAASEFWIPGGPRACPRGDKLGPSAQG